MSMNFAQRCSFFAVYDGNNGPETAWHLQMHLIPKLIEKMDLLYAEAQTFLEKEIIHVAFKKVFLSVDHEIVDEPVSNIKGAAKELKNIQILQRAAMMFFRTARAGSCALVSMYEPDARRLHVAVTGNSRAVLGRRRETPEGKAVYDLHVLSVDQTAKNPEEAARLLAAHPDEPELLDVEQGRFLGWRVTRAFGNGSMKWSRELQSWMYDTVLGDKPRAVCLTPPYFTAEPEITTTDIKPGDFMIMASDGLWDCLTNAEAVGLVGLWLEEKHNNVPSLMWNIDAKNGDKPVERGDLPVEITDNQTHYRNWPAFKKLFVNKSSNAASHLLYNAFGGADEDLFIAITKTMPPRARRLRDDISIQVVFFD
ncbi:phosphatase 2C-like domain-containing protein [Mycena amicta]|nr:phosphatase 2C-like domain-containing protein [Mycena amicta]